MNIEFNTQWPKAIRRHVYELVILNVVLALMAISYIAWQKHSTQALMEITNNYHQNSAKHYLKALEEIRHVRFHTAYKLEHEQTGKDILEKIMKPNLKFNRLTSFHLIRKEIRAALKLQNIYKDSQFNYLTDRLDQRLSNFVLSYKNYSSQDHVPKDISDSLLQLVTPIIQLEKLHSVKLADLKSKLTTQEKQQALAFYIVILIVVLIAILITWYGLKAINIVINEQIRSVEHIRLFSQAIDQSPVSIMIADIKAKLIYVNKTFENISGYSAEEVIGKNPRILQSGHTDRKTYIKIWRALSNGKSYDCELINRKKNGETYFESAHFSPVVNDLGVVSHYMAIKEDISLRKKAENALRKSEKKLTKAQKIAQLGSWELDLINNELIWSDEVFRIFEIDPDKFSASFEAFTNTIHPDDREFVNKAYRDSLTTRKPYNIEHRILLEGNRIKHVQERCETSYDNEGNPLKSVGTVLDITLRKEQENHILHQAHYDSLTNLPNRFLALDRLTQLINEAQRKNEKLAVLFLDLDDFKKVNDTLGHETGDKLLIEASERLHNSVRSGDTVGRLGGDEFILLLTELTDAEDAIPVLENLVEQFRKPFKVDNRELILTASIGISIFPGDGENASDLLRNSDSAMYYAKDLGRNTYSFYTDDMNKKVSRRLSIEEQMHGALNRNEFYVLYQPKIDISSGRIIGAEALVRWNNSVLGQVFPDEFIPVSEQTGIIVSLGNFVLNQALEMTAQWQKSYTSDFQIAVNLSPRQFRDPKMVESIEQAILQSKVPSKSLELEITEGVLMTGHSYTDIALKALNELGIELSMDDFGTGYSSLSYLRKYPFNTLKIDRSFINDITVDPADRELVNATIAMAHGLGLKVVAEGVETKEQLAYIEKQGCEFAQGYLFSRPVAPEEISEMLSAQTKH